MRAGEIAPLERLCRSMQSGRRDSPGVQERRVQHFRLPRKWLFPEPHHPSSSPDGQPRILIAEFQDLVSKEENEHAWRHPTTRRYLDELYAIIDRAEGVSTRPNAVIR